MLYIIAGIKKYFLYLSIHCKIKSPELYKTDAYNNVNHNKIICTNLLVKICLIIILCFFAVEVISTMLDMAIK